MNKFNKFREILPISFLNYLLWILIFNSLILLSCDKPKISEKKVFDDVSSVQKKVQEKYSTDNYKLVTLGWSEKKNKKISIISYDLESKNQNITIKSSDSYFTINMSIKSVVKDAGKISFNLDFKNKNNSGNLLKEFSYKNGEASLVCFEDLCVEFAVYLIETESNEVNSSQVVTFKISLAKVDPNLKSSKSYSYFKIKLGSDNQFVAINNSYNFLYDNVEGVTEGVQSPKASAWEPTTE